MMSTKKKGKKPKRDANESIEDCEDIELIVNGDRQKLARDAGFNARVNG